jgi:hypothetical protein
MQRQHSASVMPVVHCVYMCAKAKFRHHHLNVMWEIALDELGLGAAFVAGYCSYLSVPNSFSLRANVPYDPKRTYAGLWRQDQLPLLPPDGLAVGLRS